MSMRQLKITKSITTRDEASIEKYLQEIGKMSLLTPEDEAILARLIKQGDQTALDRLVKANLRFVVSVAKQYQGQGLPLSDLINEGNIGLIKAAQRFDDTRGFKFISFAVWWIRQNILFALAEQAKLVRVPLNRVTLGSRIRRTQSLLEQQLERQPTADELAEAMDIKLEEVQNTMGLGEKHLSLDTPAAENEETCLIDLIKNPNADEADGELSYKESLQQELSRTLQILPERQRETLCYFFGIGVERSFSLDDIAGKYNLTTERVRQIKDKALAKLRVIANFDLLKGFLGN